MLRVVWARGLAAAIRAGFLFVFGLGLLVCLKEVIKLLMYKEREMFPTENANEQSVSFDSGNL